MDALVITIMCLCGLISPEKAEYLQTTNDPALKAEVAAVLEQNQQLIKGTEYLQNIEGISEVELREKALAIAGEIEEAEVIVITADDTHVD